MIQKRSKNRKFNEAANRRCKYDLEADKPSLTHLPRHPFVLNFFTHSYFIKSFSFYCIFICYLLICLLILFSSTVFFIRLPKMTSSTIELFTNHPVVYPLSCTILNIKNASHASGRC